METHEKQLDETAILRQIAAARKRAASERAQKQFAVAAGYHKAEKTLWIHLANGVKISLPIALIPWLQPYTDDEIGAVCVGPAGLGLRWDTLDMDLSVYSLVQLALGKTLLWKASGAAGGKVRSEAKAAASRRNGQKGGRPRKSGGGSPMEFSV